MLADRINQALEVLNGEQAKGTIREQATTLIGEDADDRSLEFLDAAAHASYDDTLRKARKAGHDYDDCHAVSLLNVVITGVAIGKRLGIEDGEKYAKEVSGGWQ